MKIMVRQYSYLFALIISLGLNVHAQTVTEKLDNLFTSPLYPMNGNAWVAQDGRIIYKKSFGFADVKEKRSNTESSAFELASITKPITATAVLQLKDKGKFRLDDTVAKYFPELSYPEITIRQLLSHTSGLPDLQIFEPQVKKNPDKIFTNADIITALNEWKRPLASQPGEKWNYSNAGYVLLALLVEKQSGQKFEEYVRRNIFESAGMTDSYFETERTPDPNRIKNHNYPKFFSSELQQVRQDKWNSFVGNGGIVSTTHDLLKFDQALYGGKLLKRETLNEAFSPAKLTNGSNARTDMYDAFYGLGWFIFEDESAGKIVWHSGGRPGILTILLRNVTKKQTVIAFDNSFNRGTYALGINAMNLLNNKPPIVRKKSLVRDYGVTLAEKGIDAAFIKLVELKSDKANYYLDEDEMNALAYQLLYEANFENHQLYALEAARLNVVFFPDSYNVYDTYGEILAKTGKKELAILMYKKSLALNPKNKGGEKALEELLKK